MPMRTLPLLALLVSAATWREAGCFSNLGLVRVGQGAAGQEMKSENVHSGIADRPPQPNNGPSNARSEDNRRSEENRRVKSVGSARQNTGVTPESADGNGSTVSRRHLVGMVVGAGIGVTLSLPSAAAPRASEDTEGERRENSRSACGSEQQINKTVFNSTDGRSSVALPPVGARTKRIFLARHGQTDFNELMICQGRRLDPPLNKKGREQAQHLLTGVQVDAIICSPLVRAQETAEIIKESHPSAKFSVSENLIEVDFGGAEGLPQPLAAAYLAPTYIAWSQGRLGEKAGGRGESGAAIRKRAFSAAETLLSACEQGRQVLGVSHSSMLKLTLATLFDVPLGTIRKVGQDNCAVNALDFDTVSASFEAVLINNRRFHGRATLFTPGLP